MVKFVLEETKTAPEAEPKAPFSSSLLDSQSVGLSAAADRLKRDKALIIRTALHNLFGLDAIVLSQAIMSYYQAGTKGVPRPFTTTLTVSQKERLGRLAASLHRSKADILRAALYHFLLRASKEQESAVMEYLRL